MKVLSLPQPNALFVAHGYQTIVTREYDTKHRGWVAIHATNDVPDWWMMRPWPNAECLVRLNRIRMFERQWSPLFEDKEAGFDIPVGDMNVPDTVLTRAQNDLPRGVIVGVAWLAKTERTDGITERWNRRDNDWRLDDPDYNDVPAWEPSFGDFTRGRMAWWLTNPVPLIRPIRIPAEMTGFGLWDLPEEADVPIALDLGKQDIALPDFSEPAFFRKIGRRGETVNNRPRNM